jgi:hypothetical protein
MKMAGWEENFEQRVVSIRRAEVGQIERVNRYRVSGSVLHYLLVSSCFRNLFSMLGFVVSNVGFE